MPQLPAHCLFCNLTFGSGINVGPGVRHAMFSGNMTSCPRCGRPASIQDAAIDGEGNLVFLRRAREILTAPDVSRHDLERLLSVARALDPKSADPTSAATQLYDVAPQFQGLASLLKPTNPTEFWTMITALIALVALLVALNGDEDGDRTAVVNNFYNSTVGVEAPALVAATPRSAKPVPTTMGNTPPVAGSKRIAKKTRCPCGSGKRYAKCCRAK